MNLVVNSINTTLAEVYAQLDRPDLPALLWKTIDDNIAIAESDIYSYIPDMESDPFSDEGTVYVPCAGCGVLCCDADGIAS